SETEAPPLAKWHELLEQLSQTYREADQDRDALKRSVELASREAQQLYQDLKRRSESERAEQEAIMRATLESAIEGILVVDNNRRVIAVNKQFGKLARLRDSTLTARDQRVLVAAALRAVKRGESVQAQLDALDASDATVRDELELRDGALIDWFSAPV